MKQSKKPVFLIKKYKDILWAISAIEVATFFVSCADTLIAGNIIGKEALAAVGTVAPFMMLVTFFSGIVNSGTVVQYSYHIGACNLKKAQEIFSQGVILSVLAGTVILAGMLVGKDFFLATISADTEVIDYANDYYSLIVFYLCLDPLSCLLDNTMVAEGGEKVSGIANIIEIVSNLIFSIVFGVLWGVTGIAAASIVCKLLFLLINFAWFFIKKNNIVFVWRLDFKECTNILSQGIVKASTFSLSALMAFMLNYYVLAIYEDDVFVLLTVAERILYFSTFFLGLSMALQPIINTAQGEKDICAIRALAQEAGKIMMVIGLMISFVMVAVAPLLIQAFGIDDKALLAEGIDVLRLVGATIFFQALSTLLFVYYYLLGKGKLAFVVCALKDLILPVCMAIGGSMVMGSSYGLWLGLAVAPVLVICLSLVIVYMAYGKEAVPFLIQPEKNMHSYCYDFEITTENVISLSQTVMERLKDNYGDKVQSAFAAMLVEDVLLLIKSKNPAYASLYAECTIFLEEKKVTLIFRYNGVFFDTTDCNATLTSFRQYIVSALMEVPDFKTYLVTTGYNRSVISFMV